MEFVFNIQDIVVIIGVAITAIGSFLAVMRKLEGIKNDTQSNTQCITEMKLQMVSHEENVKRMFAEHKVEVQSDEVELKTMASSIVALSEKVTESEKVHIELKNAIRDLANELKSLVTDQRNFITTWNQRIEDRIEDLRKEFNAPR